MTEHHIAAFLASMKAEAEAKNTRRNRACANASPVTCGALAGVRLGRRERTALLRLADWNGKRLAFGSEAGLEEYEGEGDFGEGWRQRGVVRSSACRRAVRKLASFGLAVTELELMSDWPRSRQMQRATITDLGRLVVDTYRHELETGGRIRWAKLAAAAEAAA